MINKSQEEIMKNWVGDINNPLVSIKCTTFDHEKYISDALDGFLMQETTFPFEVIVHDDASTDNTVSIIKEYEKKYPLIIKPIYEKENQYSKHDGSLRKIINKQIKGKYIALCEGDDYWTSPYKLQKQFDALENNPDCTIAYCYVDFVDVNGKSVGISAPPRKFIKRNIITLDDFLYIEFKRNYWCFHTSSFFCRSSLLNGYEKIITNEFKDFPYGDMPTQLWYLLNGEGYLVKEEMSCYRQDTGGYNSSIKMDLNKHKRDSELLIKALRSFNNYTNNKYIKYVNLRINREIILIKTLGLTEKEYLKETLKPRNWKIMEKIQLIKNLFKLLLPKCSKKIKKIIENNNKYEK